MKETLTGIILTTIIGISIVLGTGYMQYLDNMDREVAALLREIDHRQQMLSDMSRILEVQRKRALEVQSLFTASQLLEFFAHDLGEAGATVMVQHGE